MKTEKKVISEEKVLKEVVYDITSEEELEYDDPSAEEELEYDDGLEIIMPIDFDDLLAA